MSLFVVGVISLRGGSLSRREIVEILVPAALFSLASTAYALTAAVLISSGPLGLVLLGAASGAGGALFRAGPEECAPGGGRRRRAGPGPAARTR